MSKVAAMEEMYLIYQAFRNYLADAESWGEYGVEELATSFRSFCQREPVGGMFLESVLEELADRARDGEEVARVVEGGYPRLTLHSESKNVDL